MMAACPSGPDKNNHNVVRRLAAIAFVDIVGYSILMATEETRTHQSWMTILDSVIRPFAARRRGTIVKSTGDGVLVEFPSALDAVEWAHDVQQNIPAGPTEDDRPVPGLSLRISVHLGDVITTEFDVFGDGVNVAARLQEFAPAGGIVLSEAVHDIVRGSLGTKARDLGLLELKNFEKPIRAYVLDPEVPHLDARLRSKSGLLPSIAILPLRNAGGNPADDYFSDGIVEDITLSLAALHELVVISRGSTLIYRGRPTDPRDVGRTLGVRYVLTGSVRRSEQMVRVSVELCDSNSGASLWGEKAEVVPGELFDVQDRLVSRIVAGIAPNVRAAELRAAMRKKPQNFTAYDHTLRALHIIHTLDVKTFLQAREYLNLAMAEDPEFAMPVAWAARWYNLYVGQGWSESPDADREQAVALAARAIELDRNNALALATYGHLKSFLFRDYDSALVYFERAVAACPNSSVAWILYSATLSYLGQGEQAIKYAELGLRLSPSDQSLFYNYMFLGLAHFTNGNCAEAVKWTRMSLNENPSYTATHKILAAALVACDQLDEARRVAADMMKLEPNFHLETYARRQPIHSPQVRETFIENLRKAGLPE
jgi:adenylate cyclase